MSTGSKRTYSPTRYSPSKKLRSPTYAGSSSSTPPAAAAASSSRKPRHKSREGRKHDKHHKKLGVESHAVQSSQSDHDSSASRASLSPIDAFKQEEHKPRSQDLRRPLPTISRDSKPSPRDRSLVLSTIRRSASYTSTDTQEEDDKKPSYLIKKEEREVIKETPFAWDGALAFAAICSPESPADAASPTPSDGSQGGAVAPARYNPWGAVGMARPIPPHLKTTTTPDGTPPPFVAPAFVSRGRGGFTSRLPPPIPPSYSRSNAPSPAPAWEAMGLPKVEEEGYQRGRGRERAPSPAGGGVGAVPKKEEEVEDVEMAAPSLAVKPEEEEEEEADELDNVVRAVRRGAPTPMVEVLPPSPVEDIEMGEARGGGRRESAPSPAFSDAEMGPKTEEQAQEVSPGLLSAIEEETPEPEGESDEDSLFEGGEEVSQEDDESLAETASLFEDGSDGEDEEEEPLEVIVGSAASELDVRLGKPKTPFDAADLFLASVIPEETPPPPRTPHARGIRATLHNQVARQTALYGPENRVLPIEQTPPPATAPRPPPPPPPPAPPAAPHAAPQIHADFVPLAVDEAATAPAHLRYPTPAPADFDDLADYDDDEEAGAEEGVPAATLGAGVRDLVEPPEYFLKPTEAGAVERWYEAIAPPEREKAGMAEEYHHAQLVEDLALLTHFEIPHPSGLEHRPHRRYLALDTNGPKLLGDMPGGIVGSAASEGKLDELAEEFERPDGEWRFRPRWWPAERGEWEDVRRKLDKDGLDGRDLAGVLERVFVRGRNEVNVELVRRVWENNWCWFDQLHHLTRTYISYLQLASANVIHDSRKVLDRELPRLNAEVRYKEVQWKQARAEGGAGDSEWDEWSELKSGTRKTKLLRLSELIARLERIHKLGMGLAG